MGAGESDATTIDDDVVIQVADIVIEPGDKPIYLILNSYEGVIWRFSGATQRLQNVILTAISDTFGRGPRSGAIGLPRRKSHCARQSQMHGFSGCAQFAHRRRIYQQVFSVAAGPPRPHPFSQSIQCLPRLSAEWRRRPQLFGRRKRAAGRREFCLGAKTLFAILSRWSRSYQSRRCRRRRIGQAL